MYAVMLLLSIVLMRVVTPTTTRQHRRAKWRIIHSRWRDLTIDDLSHHDGRLSPALRSNGEG